MDGVVPGALGGGRMVSLCVFFPQQYTNILKFVGVLAWESADVLFFCFGGHRSLNMERVSFFLFSSVGGGIMG